MELMLATESPLTSIYLYRYSLAFGIILSCIFWISHCKEYRPLSANIWAACKAIKLGLQIECSVALKHSMNLAVRMSTWYLEGRKLKSFWHSVTTTAGWSGLTIRILVIKMRINLHFRIPHFMHLFAGKKACWSLAFYPMEKSQIPKFTFYRDPRQIHTTTRWTQVFQPL